MVDGSVFVQQQQRDGLADDIAAPHYHRSLAGDRDAAAFQDFDDAGGRTRARSGQSGCEPADVAGVKSIDIFFGRDGEQDALLIHLFRQWKLDEDAIDIGAGVQLFDGGKKLIGGNGFGRSEGFGEDTEIVAGFDLAANVDLGCGIVAGENHRQPRRTSGGDQRIDARLQLVKDLIADARAIENLGHEIQWYGRRSCPPVSAGSAGCNRTQCIKKPAP